jgi:hypothetical protein
MQAKIANYTKGIGSQDTPDGRKETKYKMMNKILLVGNTKTIKNHGAV